MTRDTIVRRSGVRLRPLGRRAATAAAGGLAAAVCASMPAASRAQSLVVDPSAGNSPYTPPGNASYTGISVGDTGTGVLNQPAFNLTSTGPVYIGNTSSAVGTYNLSGTGSLIANTSNAGVYIGNAGRGTLNATGSGALTLGSNIVYIGNASTGVGAFTLGGTTAMTSSTIDVGFNGSGAFLQTGGTINNPGASIYIARNAATSQGVFTITAGTDSVNNLYSGFYGTGVANLSGGTITAASNMISGFEPGSNGVINVSGTTVNVSAGAYAAYAGTGVINVTGGTLNANTSNGFIDIATTATGVGTLNVSGGAVNTIQVVVADTGTGTYLQSAGVTTSNSTQFNTLVGLNNGSNGSMTLTGGTFNSSGLVTGIGTTATANVTIAGGTANFFQASNTSAGVVIVGDGSTATSTLNVSAGATVNTPVTAIGESSTGVLNLTGGTYNSTQGLIVGDGVNGVGIVNQTGGTFYTANYLITIGNAGLATYNLGSGSPNSGTLITAGFTASALTAGSTVNFNGGVLQSDVTNGTINNLNFANVLAGGAIFNCPTGATMTVSVPLAHGSTAAIDGGLTKLGAGVLTLTAANTYTGTTTVTGGTLATDTAGTLGTGSVIVGPATGTTLSLSNAASIADTASVSFYDTSTIVLNTSSGSETIAGLTDLSTGKSEANGTYTAAQLDAFFGGDNVFSSLGETITIAAPEPTSLLLAGMAAGPLVLRRRRRRAATRTG